MRSQPDRNNPSTSPTEKTSFDTTLAPGLLSSKRPSSNSDAGEERRSVSTADRSKRTHMEAEGGTHQENNVKNAEEPALNPSAVIRGMKGRVATGEELVAEVKVIAAVVALNSLKKGDCGREEVIERLSVSLVFAGNLCDGFNISCKLYLRARVEPRPV